MYQSLKLCRKQKVQLQTIVTIILAFIHPHVFTFTEIFISSYCLQLLSRVLSFYLVRLPWAFLAGQVYSLSFCLSGNVLISPSFLKNSFTGYMILGWHFFLSALWIYCLSAFWPPKFLMRNLLTTLFRTACMWWVTFLLLFSKFFVFAFHKFDYNVSPWVSQSSP